MTFVFLDLIFHSMVSTTQFVIPFTNWHVIIAIQSPQLPN